MSCTRRDLAEHAAESLSKGDPVIVTGRLRLSRRETDDGEKRSTCGVEVDEVGPSLRFATAKVAKLSRTGGYPQVEAPPDEVWATAAPTRLPPHRRLTGTPDRVEGHLAFG